MNSLLAERFENIISVSVLKCCLCVASGSIQVPVVNTKYER